MTDNEAMRTPSWEQGQHCMRTRPRLDDTRPRPKILASRTNIKCKQTQWFPINHTQISCKWSAANGCIHKLSLPVKWLLISYYKTIIDCERKHFRNLNHGCENVLDPVGPSVCRWVWPVKTFPGPRWHAVVINVVDVVQCHYSLTIVIENFNPPPPRGPSKGRTS